MDFRHAALQFATLPLAGEIDWGPDPNAFRDPKGLLQDSFEQRFDLSKPDAEPRDGVRRKAIRHEQRRRRRGHHRPRQLLAGHHRAEETNLISIERRAERRDRIEREHPPEPLQRHQEHPRGG